MTISLTRRWGRAGAAWDLAIAVPFATPWTAQFVLDLLASAHTALELPGTPPPSALHPLGLVFASLMGTVVAMWAIVRWRHPAPTAIGIDTGGRILFAGWLVWAYLQGESGTLLAFAATEIVWAVLQAMALRRRHMA